MMPIRNYKYGELFVGDQPIKMQIVYLMNKNDG